MEAGMKNELVEDEVFLLQMLHTFMLLFKSVGQERWSRNAWLHYVRIFLTLSRTVCLDEDCYIEIINHASIIRQFIVRGNKWVGGSHLAVAPKFHGPISVICQLLNLNRFYTLKTRTTSQTLVLENLSIKPSWGCSIASWITGQR